MTNSQPTSGIVRRSRGRPLGSKSKPKAGLSATIAHFDELPGTALSSIADAEVILNASRTKIYRLAAAGELRLVKIAHSTRIPVGDLRRLIGAR